MFINKSIETMFADIPTEDPAKFQIKRPSTILLPQGYNTGNRHMQGFQKTKRGEFVVSGSSYKEGYIYLTSSDYEIVKVIRPDVYDIKQRRFNHAGGCQVVDDILVVGVERSASRKKGTAQVLFYDIQDIRNPEYLPHLSISRTVGGSTAGAVAMASYQDKWLLLVANWGCQRLDFYLSNRGDLTHPAAFFSSTPVCSWSREIDGFTSASIDPHWHEYQNINLFTGQNAPDKPWFIGMYTDLKDSKANWADLYQVSLAGDQALVTKKGRKRFYRSGGGPLFRYGSGFFFNELSGCFEVYACEKHLGKQETTNRCNKWA